MPAEESILAPEEILYRRIPVTFFDPILSSKPRDDAFMPNQRDVTGLSLFRAKHVTPQEIVDDPVMNTRRKCFYVGSVRVFDLIAAGIEVRVDNPAAPAHVELPGIRYELRKSDQVIDQAHRLAQDLCFNIMGKLCPPDNPNG